MKRMVALLAGAMLLVGMATTANALSVKYSTDGITYSAAINDGGAGDFDPTAGGIFMIPGVAGFSSVKITSQTINQPNLASLFTNTIEVASTSAAQLYLLISDLPYNLSLPPQGARAITALDLLNGGKTADLETFYGTTLFDMTNLISDMDVSALGSYSKSTDLPFITNPFSLTELIIVTHDQADTSQINASLKVTPVPEPGTMMLLGAGFLGLAIYGKRRKNA